MRADRLVEARNRKGLTQDEMAKKLKIARTTYVGYETEGPNHRDPNDDTKVAIAEILEVTVDFLLGRSRNPVHTEEQDFAVSLAALKQWRDRIAAGQVVDIPKERIPHIVDALDKEILMIEQKMKEQK